MKRYTEFCALDIQDGTAKITFTDQIWSYLGKSTTVSVDEVEYICAGSLGITASGQLGAVRIPFPISGDVLSIDRATRSDWSMLVHIDKPSELNMLYAEPRDLEE